MQAPGADVEGHYCVEARGATPNDTGLEDPDLHARSAAERLQAKFTDITTHVVLRVEYMNSYDTRVAMGVLYAATLAGSIVLVVQFANFMAQDSSTHIFQDADLYVWNISVGGICLAMTSAIVSIHAWRLLQASSQKKVWQGKRKQIAVLFLIEAVIQWVNLALYLAPNIFLLLYPCYFFSPFISWCGWIRWTCWNTLFFLFLVHANGGRHVRRRTSIRLCTDGPWRLHWPCLVPWLLLETFVSVAWLRNVPIGGTPQQRQIEGIIIPGCQGGVLYSSCQSDSVTERCIFVTVGIAVAYFAVTCALLIWKLRQHNRMSYRTVQLESLIFRLQLRLRIVVMVFFMVSLVLLWLARLSSCASYAFTWLGIMPMQVVMTANTFVWTFLCMPYSPVGNIAAARIWEQEIAWSEADKPIKLVAKSMTDDSLSSQPIFCFETMMHLLYWSCLVYDYKRVHHPILPNQAAIHYRHKSSHGTEGVQVEQPQRTSMTLGTAMSLYELTDTELFWDMQSDTRCLMGWNNDQIVLAFRGTASLRNVWSDLQVWRVAHPPIRGHSLWFTRPLVHGGFLSSWLAGGLNVKVTQRINEIANNRQPGRDKLHVHVTGHSLGGALANLAAYDICKHAQEAGWQHVKVLCYTFGAPRVGNHAFATDYNGMVPDTWSVINDQDVVTRGGKLVFLYKRPGSRVVVNDLGHMMVSPSSIEASIQQSPGAYSLDQHFLTSYHHAILSVVLAQFSAKGFTDGADGIIRLVEASPYLKDLLETHMGMDLGPMRHFAMLGKQARESQTLTSAHLPPKDFYCIRSSSQALDLPSSAGNLV